jgi:hypothetical protein
MPECRSGIEDSPPVVAGFFMRGRMGGMTEPVIHARLVRLAEMYRDGIFCPGELWNQMADTLQDQDVAGLLDELPIALQEVLRECYRDRFAISENQSIGDHEYQEFKKWCLRK